MKAAVWYAAKDLRVIDVPEPPDPGPGMVKIKVHSTGICGSDLHEYVAGPIFIPTTSPHPLTGKTAPMILGHEFSGEIVDLGKGVTNISVGDRVAPDACWYDGTCQMCLQGNYNICEQLAFTGLMADGAFAEYVNVPAYTLYKLPPEVSMEAGALVEPLSCGIHAVRRGNVQIGDTVAVVGAGTIGLVTLQAAIAAGASKVIVIEKAADRKEFARKLHATAVLDPSEVDVVKETQAMTDGHGVDVAIECVGGHETLPLTVSLTRRRGRAVIMGIFEGPNTLHPNDLVFTERDVMGSLAYANDFKIAIALLASGRISADPLITGRIKIDDIVEKGFEELVNNKDKNIKIVVSLN